MNPSDLIAVFDEYLKKSGAGKNYIADKIFKLFDDKNSPFNSDGKLAENLRNGISDLTKKMKAFKIPNMNAFIKGMDSAVTTVKDFKNKFKVSSFYSFNVAMNGALREVRTFRDNLKVLSKSLGKGLGNLGIESAVGTSNVIDVRLVDISPEAESIIKSIFSKFSIKNITVNKSQEKDKEDGSFIGKIIKGMIGTVAIVAGVGFLSSFLDTPIGRGIRGIFDNLKQKFVDVLKPFLQKLMDYTFVGLNALFVELPKYFLKQTFNFFGLKQILEKENEGIAVLLTKGIYYGVKGFFSKFLNKISFGGFGKITSFITTAIKNVGNLFSKIGDDLLENLNFKGIGKALGSIAKIGGGSISKLLGVGFKTIAKRIPFVGALISFKDAADRFNSGDTIGGFISIGSGLASIFPGIGTAISIGLDVLNSLLDKKSDGGKVSKVTIIKDFFGSIGETIISKITGLFEFIIPVIEDTFKMLSDLAKAKYEEIKNIINDKVYEKGYDIASKFYNPNLKPPSQKEIQEFKESQKRLKIQKTQDGLLTNNKLIVPSSSDDVIMAKNGGPFDSAFKEMNARLDQLSVIFAQGSQLIANSTIQGSTNVVQAVVSTGGKQAPIVLGGSDPIADFRERANKTVR